MMLDLSGKHIILASGSPRRHHLLSEMGIDFEIKTKPIEEVYSKELKREEIPLYLAKEKAKAFEGEIAENEIIITADTIVWINDRELNKPANEREAKEMLRLLSGNMHEVITAVCLTSAEKQHCFHVVSNVYFRELSDEEIDHYIKKYRPFDKAGSYGIQEWIGYIGIEKLEGSYFNVMGLPTKELYEALRLFT